LGGGLREKLKPSVVLGIAHALDFSGSAACGWFETVIISTVVRIKSRQTHARDRGVILPPTGALSNKGQRCFPTFLEIKMSKIVPAAAISLPNSSGFRARARQALPVHRPPDRCPPYPRPRAGRLFADARVSADRGGEGAARVARPFVSGIRFGVSSDAIPPHSGPSTNGHGAFLVRAIPAGLCGSLTAKGQAL
jgi:hypothetical protein